VGNILLVFVCHFPFLSIGRFSYRQIFFGV
jgi:hypothetical protein